LHDELFTTPEANKSRCDLRINAGLPCSLEDVMMLARNIDLPGTASIDQVPLSNEAAQLAALRAIQPEGWAVALQAATAA